MITLTPASGNTASAEVPWPVFGHVAVSDFNPRELQPSNLAEPGYFSAVPESLRGLMIFSDERRPNGNVLEFEVLRTTTAYLAGFWEYEGNDEGDWDDERLTLSDMLNLGWTYVDDMTYHNGRVYNVLSRELQPGGRLRIRANKYSPPLLLLDSSDISNISIPEPSSLALSAVALFMLAAYCLRRLR